MMAAAGSPFHGLKCLLQSAVQSVHWTYIIFWQLSSQGGVLEWGDGYYNGEIKTRRTVQSVEVSTEEAALSRSEQLRELYDSLASGDQQVTENQQQQIRRPAVALSPEDLTETEWFYLICASFSFPPGVGLVGEAYTKQQQLWLTGANEVDSKVFTRAILAKSAHIQTVVCIPLLDGVVELGTTEKVDETAEFIRHVKSFFIVANDNRFLPPPKPALSAHSSNTILPPHQLSATIKPPHNGYPMDEDDVENDEEDEDEDEEEQNGSDSEAETGHFSVVEEPRRDKTAMAGLDEVNELLQLDTSEDIRFGSPNDGSANFNSGFDHLLPMSQVDSCRVESPLRWSDNLVLQIPPSILHASDILPPETDTHYSRTVSTILTNQLNRWPPSPSPHTPLYSTQSSFATWTSNHHPSHHPPSHSQRLLKYMLYTVPFLHSDNNNKKHVPSRLRNTSSHEELSANHVMAERRRRGKLNERFIILRSLVPLVTKMDKASILGDTIEYVKQLRKKIQDLEAAERRKIGVVEGGGGGGGGGTAVQVEVSIIESDALVEMQCRYREGLLLDVMKKLRELGVEITTVQSGVNGGMFTAEMRAKVKVKGNKGKKISIIQVKNAISLIVSPII